MRVPASVLVLASLALSGCTLLPAYERPEAPVAVHWPQGEAYAHAASATQLEARRGADTGWQAFFRDPALQQLIGSALENNRDLRIAALNVEAFRAQYRITRSERLPSVGLEGSGSRQRVVESLSPTGKTYTASQYGLGVGISAYELDFFGRVRSLSEAALQAYLATEEAQRSAQIGLVGDVALAWLAWRTDQAQLELAQATLDSYQQSLQLMELSAEAGVLSALEVRQARTLVLQAQAQVAYFVRQVAQDRNDLELLLGTTLPAGLPAGLPLGEALLAEFPVGLPSDLLVQRPDIRAAERRLLAANADIGAARAAFFPSIRLTASAGTASNELSGLFEAGSSSWRFVPQLHLPIFTGGRLSASLDYAEVRKEIRVAEYERSIQNAFREVADGLAARGSFGKQLAAQRELVRTTEEYVALAQQRFDEGVASYLTVLDARRNLFMTQQQLLSDHLAQLSSKVLLYKALGGGWEAPLRPTELAER